MKKVVLGVITTALIAQTMMGAALANNSSSTTEYKKGQYYSVHGTNWNTSELNKVYIPNSDSSNKDFLAQVDESGCVVTSVAMILKNMNVQTKKKYLDFRSKTSAFLQPDPFRLS